MFICIMLSPEITLLPRPRSVSVVRRKLNIMELREKVVFFIFSKRSKYVLVQCDSKLQNVVFWGICASVGRAGHTLIGKSVV